MTYSAASAETSVRVERCDVCIVGAGIAGVNALFVASRYLSPSQKIVLVDRRDRPGGMWVDTYAYVRLHQPHGLFTAGNIKWTLGQDRSYLATKEEVLTHFEHCLDVVKQRVHVDEYFGWTLESHDESGGIVRVICTSSDGQVMVVEAKRLIKAGGFGVVPNDPLEISSARPVGITRFLRHARGRHAGEQRPRVGRGRRKNRDGHRSHAGHGIPRSGSEPSGRFGHLLFEPRPVVPYRRPTMVGRHARDPHLHGTGSALRRDQRDRCRDLVPHYLRHLVDPTAGNYLLGLLSESENRTIAAGLNEVIMDHVVDAVDRNGDTDLIFRSGSAKTIQPGSWIVNCTGYLLRNENPYEPYVSDSGAVLSIQPRSATLHLTSYVGYFLTHLLFLDKIQDLPLYELDAPDLRKKSKAAFPYTLGSLTMHNLSLIVDSVPNKVFLDCGLDLDRWYPRPRRMIGTTRFLLTHRRGRDHLRHTLDTVRERFDVRCGPLR